MKIVDLEKVINLLGITKKEIINIIRLSSDAETANKQ